MGNLRPIGSEKLQGEDKIKRIIEISMYNDKSSSVNENKTNEYSIEMSDGVTYEIVKEKREEEMETELQRKDQIEIDEMAIMNFVRKTDFEFYN